MVSEKKQLEGINVLLGVSGGVSAYKSVELASRLRAGGAGVRTVMTQAACEFVGAKSFEAVGGGRVYTSMWSSEEDYKISHISLSDWADIIVVAPATADIIGKAANGICDDLLSTVLCTCWKKAVIFAPAMNNNMWSNPVVEKNVSELKMMGFEITGPEKGFLACGVEGVGRMSEPADILKAIEGKAVEIKGRVRPE